MKRDFHPLWFTLRLGPLERRTLDRLWARGNATVRELLEDDPEALAYTTLMTTVDRLFKKGLLTRTGEGRAFRYAPRLSREELQREAAGEAFRELLDASPAAVLPLSSLVQVLGERNAQLLDDLEELVQLKRRELNEQQKSRRAKGTE